MDLIHPIFKWLHIIAGVVWIGLLYFFNFINGHFAATLDSDSKKKVVPELMPRTLYWFRWGAAWTWVTGIVLLLVIYWLGAEGLMPADFTSDEITGDGPNMFIHFLLAFTFLAVFIYDYIYKSSLASNVRLVTILSFILIGLYVFAMENLANFEYRTFNIHLGAMFGTNMAFNVWFRIWPAQQKIISAIKNGEAPDSNLVALAGLRSKHNTYMSVPLIWTMIAVHHTGTSLSGGKWIPFLHPRNVLHDELGTLWVGLMIFIALGWHIVFQLYKKSAKIKGF
tara:strand:+ start:1607 stop:2449 length:843 start_codon:yes stop_codon:yes gene_type:complete